MPHAKQSAVAAVREALTKLDSFLGASQGEDTSCAVFGPDRIGVEPFTEAQRQAIRLYLDSWVRHPLATGLASLEGDRGWDTERDLLAYDPRHPRNY